MFLGSIVVVICAMFGHLGVEALTLSLQRSFSGAEIQYIVDNINQYRAAIARGEKYGQPIATGMTAVQWNDALAQKAQDWADNCGGLPHDANDVRAQSTPFSSVGQTLQNCSHSLTDCVDMGLYNFVKEAQYFSLSQLTCSQDPCTHFTQVAWANSRFIGCGYNFCPNAYYGRFVCNWGPSGNYVGVAPYATGSKACTTCTAAESMCLNNSLCVSPAACAASRDKNLCKCAVDQAACAANGGTFDSNNCRCNCPDSKVGINCQISCANAAGATTCSAYNAPPYSICSPKSTYYVLAPNYCAALCNVCDGDLNYPINLQYTVNVNNQALP